MLLQRVVQRSLLAALVLGFAGSASAHVFPKVPSKAERAAERERLCADARAGVSHRHGVARFGRPALHSARVTVKAATERRSAVVRFGPAPRAPHVVCTPGNVAVLAR